MLRNNKINKMQSEAGGEFGGFEMGETVESVSHEDLESNDHDQINGESLTPLKLKKM